jgi:hypothetical protein
MGVSALSRQTDKIAVRAVQFARSISYEDRQPPKVGTIFFSDAPVPQKALSIHLGKYIVVVGENRLSIIKSHFTFSLNTVPNMTTVRQISNFIIKRTPTKCVHVYAMLSN